jgi:hypothetical protein
MGGFAACRTQQAEIPSSGQVNRTVVPVLVQRDDTSTYVSYEARASGSEVNLFFAPGLPTSFSTEEARASFQYANIEFDLAQPAGVGLTLLDLTEILQLSDFERFEVVDGSLSWRLVRSATRYSKHLTNALNADNPEWCATGDILGTCDCDCLGPPIQVTLEGTLPE